MSFEIQNVQFFINNQANTNFPDFSRGGHRGGNPGVMGAGSLWEVGEVRAGDVISKGAAARRNRK